MNHCFDVELAKEYGVTEAILLANFEYWIAKNKANGVNYHDGYYWTYNSTKAFSELFPYLTQRQIQTALKNLRDAGILQTGNYNQSKYDRTLWYAFTDKGLSILHKREMDETEKVNGFPDESEPIPNNKPDKKTDNKPNKKQAADAEFESLWSLYPRKEGKKQALSAYKKAIKAGVSVDTIRNGIEAYISYIQREKVKPQYIKMGSTWFNGECWNDDYGQHRVGMYNDHDLDDCF